MRLRLVALLLGLGVGGVMACQTYDRDPRDAQSPSDAVPPDVADEGLDAAAPDATDAARADAPPADAACNNALVINELESTGSSGSTLDEFVEIFNPTSCAVSLAGWTLHSRSGPNTSVAAVVWTGDSSSRVAPSGYFVVAGVDFPGTAMAHFSAVGAGAASAVGTYGAVGLFDPAATLVDGVGFGQSMGIMIEGTAFPTSLATGQSLSRIPNGHDTQDNSTDLQIRAPSPGGVNH
jgi:hypothetical protein